MDSLLIDGDFLHFLGALADTGCAKRFCFFFFFFWGGGDSFVLVTSGRGGSEVALPPLCVFVDL